jgi:hypothetical protein
MNIDKIIALKKYCDLYLKSIKKIKNIHEKENVNEGNFRLLKKLQVDLEFECSYLNTLEHELHCLCIESGLAEIREYGEKIVNVNGWNQQKKFFRKPKGVRE